MGDADLPIDMSGTGGAFAKLTEKVELRDWLAEGGTFMYVILLVAVLGVLVGIERLIVLGAKGRASKRLWIRSRVLRKKDSSRKPAIIAN